MSSHAMVVYKDGEWRFTATMFPELPGGHITFWLELETYLMIYRSVNGKLGVRFTNHA